MKVRKSIWLILIASLLLPVLCANALEPAASNEVILVTIDSEADTLPAPSDRAYRDGNERYCQVHRCQLQVGDEVMAKRTSTAREAHRPPANGGRHRGHRHACAVAFGKSA